MNVIYAASADPVLRNDCRKARLTSTPPKAPMAPAMPMTAPARRRLRKIAGIILYVEPLPTPLKTKSAMNPTR